MRKGNVTMAAARDAIDPTEIVLKSWCDNAMPMSFEVSNVRQAIVLDLRSRADACGERRVQNDQASSVSRRRLHNVFQS